MTKSAREQISSVDGRELVTLTTDRLILFGTAAEIFGINRKSVLSTVVICHYENFSLNKKIPLSGNRERYFS